MLRARGVTLASGASAEGAWVELAGGQRPAALDQTIPADISSAAFLLIAAAMRPGSEVILNGVGVNPTRTGALDVLHQAGVVVERDGESEEGGEPAADLSLVSPPRLRPFRIDGDLVPRLIDEIPVLAVLATRCEGTSVIRDARELRVKESDRIEEVAAGLRQMGAEVETFEDGLAVLGPCRLRHGTIDAKGDHRIAMAFAVAGLAGDGATIDGVEAVATSYPDFLRDIDHLRVV
jgi:3-phosphoshikimate 1-carboxyvinyltransferase